MRTPVRQTLVTMMMILMTGLLFPACKDSQPAAPAPSVDIAGIPLDEQGYIIPYATVEAVGTSGTILSTTMTDDLGNFTLKAIPTDQKDVSIRISRDDFRPFSMKLPTVIQTGTADDPIIFTMVHADSACGRLALLIRDLTTLQPIVGAEVRLKRNGTLVTTVTSDATGRVSFNHLMAGAYTLRISKSGYSVVERSATIQFCDSTSLDIRMTPGSAGEDSCCHGILTVVPMDSASNTILNNVSVKVSKVQGDTRSAITSGGQPVVFQSMCPGTYNLRLARDGYTVQEFSITMGCNEVVTHTRVLTPKPGIDSCCQGAVTLFIRDSVTNTPIANATVKLWFGSSVKTWGTTNASGSISFTGLCMGSYQVNLIRETYKTREFTFTLGCNEQKALELTMKPQSSSVDTCHTAKLKFRVKDSTIAEAGWLNDVLVTISRGTTVVTSGYTNAEGWYLAENLQAPATYTVTFSRQGFGTRTYTFTFNECKLISETIRL